MRSTDRPLLGILYANGGLVAMALNDAVIRGLSAAHSPLQIGFVRLLLMTIFVGALILGLRRTRLFVTRRIGLLGLRGALSAISTVTFFFSLKHLDEADVYSVALVAPIIVALLSGRILGEYVPRLRWVTILVGFVGVVVALGPGVGLLNVWVLLALVSAAAYAFAMMLNRILSRTEDSLTIVFYMSASACVILLPSMPSVWKPIPLGDWLPLTVVGLLASVAHYFMVQAYRYATAHTIITFDYVSVLYVVIIGYTLFAQVPRWNMVFGLILLVSCGVFIIIDEARQHIRSPDELHR